MRHGITIKHHGIDEDSAAFAKWQQHYSQ